VQRGKWQQVAWLQGNHLRDESAMPLIEEAGFQIVSSRDNLDEHISFLLALDEKGLCLHSLSDKTVVHVDFTVGAQAHRRKYGGGKGQLISKAVGVNKHKHLSVLDLTAGLGKDAFVLASQGCEVTLVEKNPVVFLLLQDGLNRAREFARVQDSELQEIMSRMDLVRSDGIDYLRNQQILKQQVVYLDPMFPERQKSASVKKDMVMLQSLLEKPEMSDVESENEALFEAVKQINPHRIVVKRPKLAPCLGGTQPALQFKGSSGRFDVYPYKSLAGEGSASENGL